MPSQTWRPGANWAAEQNRAPVISPRTEASFLEVGAVAVLRSQPVETLHVYEPGVIARVVDGARGCVDNNAHALDAQVVRLVAHRVRSLELGLEHSILVGVHWQQRVRAAQLGRRDKQEAWDLSQADRVPIAFPDLGGIEPANHGCWVVYW